MTMNLTRMLAIRFPTGRSQATFKLDFAHVREGAPVQASAGCMFPVPEYAVCSILETAMDANRAPKRSTGLRSVEEAQVWDPATHRFRPISEVRACTRPFALPAPDPRPDRRLNTFLSIVLLGATLAVMVILTIALTRPGGMSALVQGVRNNLSEIQPAAPPRTDAMDRPSPKNRQAQNERKASRRHLAAGLSIVMEQSTVPVRPSPPVVAEIDGARPAAGKPRESSLTVNVARGEVMRSPEPGGSDRAGSLVSAGSSVVNLPRAEAAELLRALAREGVAPNQQGKIRHEVRLAASLGSDGLAHAVQPLSGAPTLAKAALDAVKRSRYEPYYQDGRPVDMKAIISVNFTIAAR